MAGKLTPICVREKEKESERGHLLGESEQGQLLCSSDIHLQVQASDTAEGAEL